MAFAFAGASRSGKSTTAKIVAQRLGLPFVDSSVSKELLAAGYDQVSNLDPERRMECQVKRLELHMEKYLAAPKPCVTDRSPLDIAAYTLAEFPMHSNPEFGALAHDLATTCIKLTRQYYDLIIIPRPLPVYTVEEGKPPENLGYQWHIQYLIEGLTLGVTDQVTMAQLTEFSLENRCDTVTDLIQERLAAMDEWRVKQAGRLH